MTPPTEKIEPDAEAIRANIVAASRLPFAEFCKVWRDPGVVLVNETSQARMSFTSTSAALEWLREYGEKHGATLMVDRVPFTELSMRLTATSRGKVVRFAVYDVRDARVAP